MANLFQTLSSLNITTDAAVINTAMYTTASWFSEDNGTVTQTITPPEGCLVIPFSVSIPWDNPEDLVSRKTQEIFEKFVYVYMLNILLLVCVPTNVVNMVVFWKHGLRERINLCLFCLAFSDLMVVIFPYVIGLDRMYTAVTGIPVGYFVRKFLFNNKLLVLASFTSISGFLSTLIACERCLCVLSPLKAQRIIQTRTMAVIIFIGHIMNGAGHYVFTARWQVVCMFDPLTGQIRNGVFATPYYKENKVLVDLFNGVIFGILVPGLYATVILASTIATVLKLRHLAEWRQQSSSVNTSGGGNANKDVTLTQMLIGTSILFTICSTPKIIVRTALPFVPELNLGGKYFNTYMMLTYVIQLFTFINSSVNFFIYYFFGTKFRHSVQSMFCKARLATALESKKKASDRPQDIPETQ